ncbi:hypothetical protein EPUS_01635 [Endocarpon pusillum Z07020]|uniref:Cytochrome P450 n=1 Tax=Endocarpon pusillum (strain Z07020 / HMAS-L-300199) TaxID=1263415 RepID=U1HY79_ENDPU|nr:uncharacterized protein EPUS_01635 [Endocarpon pusillum Z07020]ERF75805.1 hypothetical protein EPUS_01635 [Endocarpon pusillum Z07020]
MSRRRRRIRSLLGVRSHEGPANHLTRRRQPGRRLPSLSRPRPNLGVRVQHRSVVHDGHTAHLQRPIPPRPRPHQPRTNTKVSEHPDDKVLANNPLLVSIYCETLRVYVKSYFLTSNQHADIPVGQWRIPKERIVFVNSGISHMDDHFWNTQNGRHPVDSNWGERFIVDPSDPFSGPVRPEVMHEVGSEKKKSEASENDKPFVSMNGLEGSWIPYGGEHAICPGRFLAKSAILLACALMVENFDMEILTGDIEMS